MREGVFGGVECGKGASQSCRISGRRCRSRQRWISFLAFGGQGKSRMASISSTPGQSLVFTWQSTPLVEPMISNTPRLAAARVQA